MSKTFIYLLVTIGVFLVVIKPLNGSEEGTKNNETGNSGGHSSDRTSGGHSVSTGAKGNLRYRVGYTN